MDNLIYSLNGTVPIFAVMVIGYLLKKNRMLDEDFVAAANRLVFKVGLPVMIFLDMWKANVNTEFDIKFVLFCFLATAISFALIWIGAELFLKDKTMIGSFVQGSFRSSAAILGLAFIKTIYPNLGMAPLMIIGAVPFYNVASVVVLTFRGKDQANVNGSKGIKKALINIITNPIIIGIVLGCVASLIRLKLPVMVTKTLNMISDVTVPLALIAIGAGFTFAGAKERKRPACFATLIKLGLLPMVVIPAAIFFGYHDQELLAVIIMSAGPATATGYTMAREMNNDYVLSSYIIVLTTIFSAFTLTGWIFLARCLGCLH